MSDARVWIERVLLWLFMIALGPIHAAGELVGPLGGVSWRQIVALVVGTWLWVAVGWFVLSHFGLVGVP